MAAITGRCFGGTPRCAAVVTACLVVHACMLAHAAARHSPTMNELSHLVAGLAHLRTGRFDLYRVNPPLVRSVAALPLLMTDARFPPYVPRKSARNRLEFELDSQFVKLNGRMIFWYCTLARWACLPFSLVGALCCYCWGRDLYGRRAGLGALLVWCASPSILANASLMTPDAHAAALGLLAGYQFWRWLAQPTWARAARAGASLALAELAKSTWVILFVLWPVMWLGWRLMFLRWRAANAARNPPPGRQPPAGQLAAILLGALYL